MPDNSTGAMSCNAGMEDKHFMRMAMEADMAEIQLSQLALQKSSNDQVKQFAQRMVDDHTKLDAQMKPMAMQAGVDAPTDVSAKHKAELAKLQNGNHVPGTPDVAAGQLPQAGLEYIRKYRDVKYHETLYEALAKQYEAARLDEAKSAPLVQIIDNAVVPDRKSWPPRTLLVVIASGLAGLATSFWIFIKDSPGKRGIYTRPAHIGQGGDLG